jgi:uncharacterized protein (TIGR03435 family)
MKRQQAEVILNRFLEECGKAEPAQSHIDPVLDRVWERLEWKADEFVNARMPAAPTRPLRFAWVMGILLVVVFVNVVVWRQGAPFSVAVNTGNTDDPLSRFATEPAGETVQIAAPQDVFEVASVKLLPASSDAVKNANQFREIQSFFSGCPGGPSGSPQLTPDRLTIPYITVLSLVVLAYGKDCTLVEGEPEWARFGDYYEIRALFPPGTPSYTQQDLQKGNAPTLQRMLQNLLADRFRLVVKRELREMSVYTLTVANRGKLKLSPDQTPPDSSSPPVPMAFSPVLSFTTVAWGRTANLMNISGETQLSGHAVSLSDLAKDLRRHAGRIVVDKTGLNGLFDFDLKFAGDPPPPMAAFTPMPPQPTPSPQSIPPVPGPPAGPPPAPPPPQGARLPIALEDQLGLKLESARMPVEVLIIEKVERPSEN